MTAQEALNKALWNKLSSGLRESIIQSVYEEKLTVPYKNPNSEDTRILNKLGYHIMSNHNGLTYISWDLERIFPELKESNDEKMRNFIINELACLRATDEKGSNRYEELTNAIGWLEKQCKNSTDKIEPRFKVGDWIVFIKSKSVYQVEKKENYEYTLRYILGGSMCLPFSNEGLIKKWTIQDVKDGDVLALSWLEDKNLWEKIIIFKKYHSEGVKGICSMPCVEGYGITFKNGKMAFTEKVPYYSKTWTCNLYPATKEQRDILMKAMNDAGYEWDAENKELKKKCKR